MSKSSRLAAWFFLSAFLSAGQLRAQSIPPIMVVQNEKKSEQLRLSQVEIRSRLLGGMAETEMTMTFMNSYNRQLAGEFYLPLPEGATITGYALDIQGKMIDGVVVEKAKARQVFEKVVRQNIDPGLLEWTRGNTFRTRVFPIPAKGSRRIRVKYISELEAGPRNFLYALPLYFPVPLQEFYLRLEAPAVAARPRIKSGAPATLAFHDETSGASAEIRLHNAALAQTLIVEIPFPAKQTAMVQKDAQGEYYFLLCDSQTPNATVSLEKKKQSFTRIGIFWDASASRGKTEHRKELFFLKTFLNRWQEKPIEVQLVLFRIGLESPQIFQISQGKSQTLINTLQQVKYDGASQLGCLDPSAFSSQPDMIFLFSDGLANFGKQNPQPLQVPIYAFSDDFNVDFPFLRRIAWQNGGESFNLASASLTDVIARIVTSAPLLLSVVAEEGRITEVYPSGSRPVSGRLLVAGKLLDESALITIIYGSRETEGKRRQFRISRSEATTGVTLRTFWAMKKIEELQSRGRRQRAEINETGKRFGLVTAETSLLVLDALEQYVQNRIAPPESLPEMRRQYEKIMAERNQEEKRQESEKISQVLELWQKRVEWWNKSFFYPENFRYQEAGEKKAAWQVDGSAVAPSAMAERAAGGLENEAAKNEEKNKENFNTEPAIALQAWNPDTPYLKELRKANAESRLAIYLEQRAKYGQSPAFFLDCADFFYGQQQKELALRVLSNIAELELEDAALLRVLAHRLQQLGLLDLSVTVFEEVLRLRPEEPQSYRDLALVLADQEQYKRAIPLLYQVVKNRWDRFAEIEVIALTELNQIMARARAKGMINFPVDPRLSRLLDVDIRIVLTWDADLTDIDLWVTEPSGEKAFYGHNLTTIGGLVSRDFTQGYGPEEYILRRAMPGLYKIESNFFGSSAQSLIGAVTLQLDIFTNYGRKNEQRKSITLRLTEKKETILVGQIEF